MKKYLLVLCVLFLAAGCGKMQSSTVVSKPTPTFEPSPTPSQTTDWSVYTNSKYGYSISYPSTWEVMNYDTGTNFQNPNNPNKDLISIWVSTFNPENIIRADNSISEKTISIDVLGIKSQKLIGQGAVTAEKSVFIIIPKDGKYYVISSQFTIAEKIVSTFSFTEPNNSTSSVKKSKNGIWTLVSGDPADTCSSPTYSGKISVMGWYVLENVYDTDRLFLKLRPEDAKKLPLEDIELEANLKGFSNLNKFNVTTDSVSVDKKLKNASENNPVELVVTSFTAYCEGAPIIKISE